MNRVVVSIVTYNSAKVIAGCLQSLPSDVDIVIQDNGSRDNTLDIVRRERPDAVIHALRRNLGFGRAHNRTIHATNHEFVLILNPDTVMLPGCIDHLLKSADTHPDAGMIGAVHQQEDGTPNPCYRNDFDYYPQLARDKNNYQAKGAGCALACREICAEQITGALMLLRRSVLHVIKGFNPSIFMYFEDDDLCARMRKAGYSVIVEPAARVVHFEGKSAGGSRRVACIKGYQFERSRKIVYAHYHGCTGLNGLIAENAWRCIRRMIKAVLCGNVYKIYYYAAGLRGVFSRVPRRCCLNVCS